MIRICMSSAWKVIAVRVGGFSCRRRNGDLYRSGNKNWAANAVTVRILMVIHPMKSTYRYSNYTRHFFLPTEENLATERNNCETELVWEEEVYVVRGKAKILFVSCVKARFRII